MKKNKGFTLIELLVVIAIIGILASVVLASLSGARTKAKVAAVQSTLSSARAQAEIGMINGKYITNICGVSTSGGLQLLVASLNKVSSKVAALKCGSNAASAVSTNDATKWAIEAQINNVWYCSDSSGYSGLSKKAAGDDGAATTTGPAGITSGSTATSIGGATAYTGNYGTTLDLDCTK